MYHDKEKEMKLSAHFSLKEAIESSKAKSLGLDNIPDSVSLETMKFTALRMEAVRQLLGNEPIKINSWFRGPEVNKAVGGVSNSQHAKGEAVDFTAPFFGTPLEVCQLLEKHKDVLQYDQLIYEQTWVHISFVKSNPRGNELTFLGKGKYKLGIHA